MVPLLSLSFLISLPADIVSVVVFIMEKAVLRRQILAQRNSLDSKVYESLSLQAQQSLLCTEIFRLAKRLALYSPINNEVRTEKIFVAATRAEKQVFYPRVNGSDLNFCEVGALDELSPGSFNVMEPTKPCGIAPEELDLIVLPGVAFDIDGRRLGYGKGFYDRFLALTSPECVVIGLGFDLQLKAVLPEELHDQKVSFLATESRFIPCR
jgi:5-formyltetrahydrofolate cyclo-ligase